MSEAAGGRRQPAAANLLLETYYTYYKSAVSPTEWLSLNFASCARYIGGALVLQ